MSDQRGLFEQAVTTAENLFAGVENVRVSGVEPIAHDQGCYVEIALRDNMGRWRGGSVWIDVPGMEED